MYMYPEANTEWGFINKIGRDAPTSLFNWVDEFAVICTELSGRACLEARLR
jgi:hypothetical protein